MRLPSGEICGSVANSIWKMSIAVRLVAGCLAFGVSAKQIGSRTESAARTGIHYRMPLRTVERPIPLVLGLAVGLALLSLIAAAAVAVQLAPWVWIPAIAA